MSDPNTQEESKGNSLSSLLPIFAIGAVVILLIQVFTADEGKPPQPLQKEEQSVGGANGGGDLAQFEFRSLPEEAEGETRLIDTGHFIIKVSSKGGRIAAMYLKSHDDLKLPERVIEGTGDPIAVENRALEITRGNGMDFQPHLYYSGNYREQMANPPLNNAAFQLESFATDERTGMTEVRFSLPLRLKGHRLELRKIFRFLPGENYFRQITVLRNLEPRDFVWGSEEGPADLFYKPFGDLGPVPEGDALAPQYGFGRFWFYNEELKSRFNQTSGGGAMACSPLGGACGGASDDPGTYSVRVNSPNTLEFLGAKSRYFFAYTEFMDDGVNPLHQPDGLIWKNAEDPRGSDAFTATFREFRLRKAEGKPLELGSLENLTQNGELALAKTGNREAVLEAQRVRNDALIVDNKVFVGIRSDEAHSFKNDRLIAAEFGQGEPNDEARSVIFTSGFLAIFSVIRDGIIWVMRHLYEYIGNYGWCIIIIAVGFKLLTWPLNQMQVKSMKRMQALKPELDALNEKYADNPQAKQQKLMELYKKHNVNPMKGCLPILIQMPVFIALYSAFSESIELWQSPFIFWIDDLSKPDTVAQIPWLGWNLNILPLVMVVTQIAQQHFTTMVTDNQQKMIMYMMPLMMLLFFWQIPSGVTLYWTIQNMIAIVWQAAANKWASDDDPSSGATPKPA